MQKKDRPVRSGPVVREGASYRVDSENEMQKPPDFSGGLVHGAFNALTGSGVNTKRK